MGTFSKGRIEGLRSNVGHRFEKLQGMADEKSHHEGKLTKGIETITSALPSTTWLVFAGVSIVGALTFKMLGRNETANFVGQWAPTFLILGLYNKFVKVAGSERLQNAA